MDRPNHDDVREAIGAAGKWSNLVTSVMLRYMNGGYQIGLEYAHWLTRYDAAPPVTPAAAGGIFNSRDRSADLAGNQLMLSGFYFF